MSCPTSSAIISKGGRGDFGPRKQKINQKSQQYRKPHGRRETEAERMKRIQLERQKKPITITVGDTITVENADGKEATFTITGVCENYVYHYLYMSADVYREAFGEDPEVNLLYCSLADGVDTPEAEDELSTALLKCRDVAGAQFTHEITASFSQSLGSINYIVVVLIIAAGALAFVVLYNLTNINITERSKELATIKVLGFYDNEVGAYIYRETSILALIGTACGTA